MLKSNYFADKSIHTASLKTRMVACHLIFEFEIKE